jgi:hypothetical protein
MGCRVWGEDCVNVSTNIMFTRPNYSSNYIRVQNSGVIWCKL